MAGALPLSGGPDFEDWLPAGEGALQRTAHLLTGNVYAAQDLVQNTLAQLYRGWDRIRDGRRRRRLRPPGARQRVTAPRGVGRDAGSSSSSRWCPTAPRRARRRTTRAVRPSGTLVCSLPPKQRTVVVLRFYEQLTEAEIADLMGISVDTVTSQSSRALASLRALLLDHPEFSDDDRALAHGTGSSAEDLLTRTLTEVVETTDYPTTSTATVAARSRALVHARRRATALRRRGRGGARRWRLGGGPAGPRPRDDREPDRAPRTRADAPRPPAGRGPAGRLSSRATRSSPRVAQRVTAPAFRTATTAATVGDGVLVASRTTTQRPFAVISLVSSGSTRRLGCGTPSFAVGSGDPAYWLSAGLSVRRPGAAVPRHDGHADAEGRDLLPGREHEPRPGGRRHPGAPAGRRLERTGPDRPGRLAQPDPPRRGGRGGVAVGRPGGGHRRAGQRRA